MKAAKYIFCGVALLALVLGSRLQSLAQNVTYDEILHSASHPEDWLTYGGNYASQRFSELKQINKTNVDSLKLRWVYQLRRQGIFESSPIVVDGMMYVTERWTFARDAPSGDGARTCRKTC
jgi:glucose dehydrogenase